MGKRDKYEYLTGEIERRLASMQTKLATARGGGKAKLAGEIQGLEFALDAVNKVFDRRTKTLVCPNGHKFDVGLFKSVKEGVPCKECGTPAFKVLGRSKPKKQPPKGPTTAEIEDAALERAKGRPGQDGSK